MIVSLTSQTAFLKESITQIQDDQRINDEITFLKRKIENISSTLLELKIGDERLGHKSPARESNGAQVDMSAYLESHVFSDFRRHVMKELELNAGKLQDARKVTEDIINLLTTKVTEKDLKFLEGNI